MHGIPVTKTTIAALRWYAEHEPVALFDVSAPSSVMRKRLETARWVERCGTGRFGFVAYRLSDEGRKILETQAVK